jgi:hypothetical protein
MKNVLFVLLILLLYTCGTSKESNKESSIPDKVEIVNKTTDTTSNYEFEKYKRFDEDTFLLVKEMQIIEEEDKVKDDVKAIEQHEKNTKLKVIDKTSDVIDTNKGWIAYSVSENMQVAKNYSIKVRISKLKQNKSVLILGNNDAINNPEYESVATIEDIKVSGEMLAELRGDTDIFNIVSLSTETQNIDTESYTEWEWIVTPKRSGDTPLKLIIKLKGLNKDIIVFNKTIKIKSNVPVVVEGFFDKYWQWIMTTIIIPIFLYFWNRKKKRKTKKS